MLNWYPGVIGSMSQSRPSKRDYRRSVPSQVGWFAYTVRYKESDLWIQTDLDFRQEAETLLLEARLQLELYAREHSDFLTAYVPLPQDPKAPELVKWMVGAGLAAGVGPMAAVAGAIAKYVGEGLLSLGCKEVVVENGGDIYLAVNRELLVGLYAGSSPLSGHLGIRIRPGEMPIGVATSSAKVGHSWSYGATDAACVVARDSVLADATATALGNRVREISDMEKALEWVCSIEGVVGAVLVLGKAMAAKGGIQLTSVRGR